MAITMRLSAVSMYRAQDNSSPRERSPRTVRPMYSGHRIIALSALVQEETFVLSRIPLLPLRPYAQEVPPQPSREQPLPEHLSIIGRAVPLLLYPVSLPLRVRTMLHPIQRPR